MLDVSELCFSYGKGRPLFDDLSLRLKSGKIYGLLGKNGAGKTSLLKILAGLLFPDGGQSLFLGRASGDRSVAVLQDIFFVPEVFTLPAVKPKVYESLYASFYPRFDRDFFQKALGEFEIEADKTLTKMSYGQQKKFLIAFALACNARLYLLDEPTNGLDIPSKSQFRRLAASSLNEEKTLVISTHQARDLQDLIDTVTILEGGRIVFHQDLFTVRERIGVFTAPTAPSDALFAQEHWGNWTSLVSSEKKPPKDAVKAVLDLELLFNAVIAEPAVLSQAAGVLADEEGVNQ